MTHWGEKRYHSLDYELKKTCHQKLYKVSINGGMTCPNRDGTLGRNGCIFCSTGGSGDFAPSPALPISQQIEEGLLKIQRKAAVTSCIAYFQAYTNTYAPISRLRQLFKEAISHPLVSILSIATRPDCLGEEVLDLLEELNKKKPVWVELGLQTVDETSVAFIRRGYENKQFEQAVRQLRRRNITVIVHTIIGLPSEASDGILHTIDYVNALDIQGIKLQLLHVLRDTDLALVYEKTPFWIPTMEEYIELLGQCISHLRPDIVIHRLTGDGPKTILIAPLWTGNKRLVLNSIQHYLKENDIWQGKEFRPQKTYD